MNMSSSCPPRKTCPDWASKTYGEAVADTFWKSAETRSKLLSQLSRLGIKDVRITGHSVKGLQKTHEGFGARISYTETFSEVMEKTGGCHPIDYLYTLVEKAISKNLNDERMTGLLARGMRTLASLMRDTDFFYTIAEKIKKEKLNLKVVRTSAEDSKSHTDVLIRGDKNLYRIWLFQNTRLGIPHDIERITGERGELPPGIHILCPLNSEVAISCEEIREKIRKNKERLKHMEKELKETEMGARLTELKKASKTVLSGKIDELVKEEEAVCKGVDEDVDICEGWYFYSTKKIESVLSLIKNMEAGKNKPEKYSDVCEQLNSPKKYLSKTSSFEIK
jgi:uncharacterized membrane protein YfbV (UPF0208 family)